MNIQTFDSEQYLALEAERLKGRVEHFTLPNGNTFGMIAKPVPTTNLSDIVSVYGYPDQFEKNEKSLQNTNLKEVLEQFGEIARQRNLVSGYFRLGLASEIQYPSCNQAQIIAQRTKIGEVVAVDLNKDSTTLKSEYRKKLRYDLRQKNDFVVERSQDFTAFHEIYFENMVRVGAAEHYFFDLDYISALIKIPGVELWLARNSKFVVAGGIFIQQGENIFYHLGATADRALVQSPLKHVLHTRIMDLSRSGFKNLVLGGGLGGGDDALFRFKRGFSQLTLPVHALRIVFDTQAYSKLSGQRDIKLKEDRFFPAYRTA